MYVYIYYTCIYIYICIYIHTCVYIYTYVVYISIYIYLHIYIYTHIYINTHIYIYYIKKIDLPCLLSEGCVHRKQLRIRPLPVLYLRPLDGSSIHFMACLQQTLRFNHHGYSGMYGDINYQIGIRCRQYGGSLTTSSSWSWGIKTGCSTKKL